jgi:hypothetical protein
MFTTLVHASVRQAQIPSASGSGQRINNHVFPSPCGKTKIPVRQERFENSFVGITTRIRALPSLVAATQLGRATDRKKAKVLT